MKVEIKVTCSELTEADRIKTVRLYTCRELPNHIQRMQEHVVTEAWNEIFESFKQALVADKDKLILACESGDKVEAILTIITP